MGIQSDLNTPVRHLLTVEEEFLLLDGAGAFEAYARAELIEGEVFTLNALYRSHGGMCFEIGHRLRLALDAAVLSEPLQVLPPSRCSSAITACLSPMWSSRCRPKPTASSRSTKSGSRSKSRIRPCRSTWAARRVYARHAVPEYWVVDINGRQIHRMADPSHDGYVTKPTISFGEPAPCGTIPEIVLDTTALA
jgi:hypothetical protein